MQDKQQISAEEAVKKIAETYAQMAKYASDIAYARRNLYEAYLLEGFTPIEALELCKTL
jgi:hypothetical protein